MKSFFLLFCEYSNLILNYSDLLFYTESSQLDCLLQKQSYKQSSELHPALFVSKIFILFFFLIISVAVSTAVVGRLSAVYDEAIDGLERVRLWDMHGNSTVHLSIFIMVIVWSYSLVNNFISLSLVFVALNIVIYGLMLRESTFSADATLKYFALGAAATASLFVGIFLHILAYGSAEYSTMGFLISRTLTCSILVNSLTWVHILAFILVLSSFLFKLGVYPYHFYLVDIYEGVRLESLVIITIPVKLATYFALLNFLDALGYLQVATQPLFVLIGLGSVLTGTYGAYLQNKLRCFWAYSYINSMGFVFLGFQYSVAGFTSVVGTYYLVVYLITWLGILLFFILVVLRQRSTKFKFIISELRYVSQLSDVASVGIPLQACLQILLLSLTGVPPTLGFFAKFFVLANCMSTWTSYTALLILLFVLPLNAYNYLRIIQALSFQFKPVRRGNSTLSFELTSDFLGYLFLGCIIIVCFAPMLIALVSEHLGLVYYDLYDGVGFGSNWTWVRVYS